MKKGAWKENGNDMFCLLEPNSQYTNDSDFDTFADIDEESNNNCYYIDFNTNMTESETTDSNTDTDI